MRYKDRTCIAVADCGLLVQTVQNQLVVIGCLVWQGLGILSSLLELCLRVASSPDRLVTRCRVQPGHSRQGSHAYSYL